MRQRILTLSHRFTFARPAPNGIRDGIQANGIFATEPIQEVLAPSTRLSRVRIRELDGIRGLAILSVLAYHLLAYSQQLWAHYRGTLWSGLPKVVNMVTWPGFLGVDIFFVLSGFLITGILLDEKGDPSFLRNFYARRAVRILPAYFAVLAVIACTYSDTGKYLLLSVFFLSNLALLLGIQAIGPFWSLAVEEHFYLIWPLVVRSASKQTLVIVAVLICALEPLIRIGGFPLWGDGYFYSWTRFDGLAWGALVACFARSKWATRNVLSKLTWACFIAALTVLGAGIPFGLLSRSTLVGTGFQYLPAQLTSVWLILLALANRANLVTCFLRHRMMRLLGDLSYCLYLVHMLVMDGYDTLVNRFAPGFEPALGSFGALVVRALVVLVFSFGLALLSRRYLERPALQLKRYLERKPTPALAMTARCPLVER
jgi:peptidoglycan/LPS O-acetylase OafA/YrhL